MGDASSFHRTLAEGLRRLGHSVTVASDGGGWMHTGYDVDISRRWGSKAGGALHFAWLAAMGFSRFRGYDVVSVFSPYFLRLKPERIGCIFDILRRNNRGVFLSATCTDGVFVEECMDAASPIAYSEFRLWDKPGPMMANQSEEVGNLLHGAKKRLLDHVYANIDGALSAIWEYDVALRRRLRSEQVSYSGIPIDTRIITPYMKSVSDKVNILIGIKRGKDDCKGYGLMIEAAQRVEAMHAGKCRVVVRENLSYDEYLREQRGADILMDQVYSYTPATNALQAMAYGVPVMSGAEPEFYDFIGERQLRPIVNLRPDVDDIMSKLGALVTDRERLQRLSRESREFVVRHNDCDLVARRCVEFWQKRLNDLGK